MSPAPMDPRKLLVYQSRVMHDAVHQALCFARSSATVMLSGESGTGKELFARLIHHCSPRREQRLVRVNCAALSETLMESELFGHERGAFTGAVARRIGRFEWAQRGTLLLDEVTEVPVRMQAKLLRVLEESEFQRVGSNESLQSDVRIIATTNRDLQQTLRSGEFRTDLFHRLSVLTLHVPALRERREDIPLLVQYFMRRYASESRQPLRGVELDALRALCNYHWPGNVRELRNTIHRACVLAQGEKIGWEALPTATAAPDEGNRDSSPIATPQTQPLHSAAADSSDWLPQWMLQASLDHIERVVITRVLQRFAGNKTAAAEQLGVTPRTLTNKLKLYREAA